MKHPVLFALFCNPISLVLYLVLLVNLVHYLNPETYDKSMAIAENKDNEDSSLLIPFLFGRLYRH